MAFILKMTQIALFVVAVMLLCTIQTSKLTSLYYKNESMLTKLIGPTEQLGYEKNKEQSRVSSPVGISDIIDRPDSPIEHVRFFESRRHGRRFCVFPNVLQTSKRNGTITMLLHTSSNYFGTNLLKTARKWDGRISMAVMTSSLLYSERNDSSTVENTMKRVRKERCDSNGKMWNTVVQLYKMSSCYNYIRDAISAHVFMVWDPAQRCPSIEVDFSDSTGGCDELEQNLGNFKYSTISGIYPVNTARNIARMYDMSEYILFADMEQEYSRGAEARLRNLTETWNIKENKWALTVRRFEFDESRLAPETMSELRKAYGKWAFSFHRFVWSKGHFIPGMKAWMNNISPDVIKIVDIRMKMTAYWEPMFVVHNSIPYHNEEIPYGKNNHVALALHMCCAGYVFPIAPGVFNMHPGVKRRKPTRGMTKRSRIVARVALKRFYLDMKERYPNTAKQCLKRFYPVSSKKTVKILT